MATAAPSRPPVFNLPNILTSSRLVLAVILFALIEYHLWFACLAIFAVAAFTDWLDGYVARRQGLVSTLGRNLDPLVDKVLVCGAFIFLLQVDNSGLAAWMVTVVVARELIISSLRGFLENRGATFGADLMGKLKMTLQCAALVAIFVVLIEANEYYVWTRDTLIYGMILATALSGLEYLWRAWMLVREPTVG